MLAAKVLRDAAKIVLNGWTQHYSATDDEGNPTTWKDESAVNFCAIGAVERSKIINKYDAHDLLQYVHTALNKNGFYNGVTMYNDMIGRKSQEIADILTLAAEISEDDLHVSYFFFASRARCGSGLGPRDPKPSKKTWTRKTCARGRWSHRVLSDWLAWTLPGYI